MPGLFVTLEGPDGGGKSTQLALLGEALAGRDPLLVREPGHTPIGEHIRVLLLHRGLDLGAEAEMYLFMAARAELLRRDIAPALAAGRLVVADRYHDSTMVYQGLRGAPVFWPDSFPRPDLTILVQVDAEVGLARREHSGTAPDRLEAASIEFHRAVTSAYAARAAAEPGRFLVVDGTLPPERITARALERIDQLVGVRS